MHAQGQRDHSPPRPENEIESCKALATTLEAEYAQLALQEHLETIRDKAASFGNDEWPQALWTMPKGESESVWNAARVRSGLCSLLSHQFNSFFLSGFFLSASAGAPP